MNDSDREHTQSIISQHKVKLEHLMYGMGFRSTGPTEQRKQMLLSSLTGNFDDKPPMRADCATILINAVIAYGKTLQFLLHEGSDEEDAENEKHKTDLTGTRWDPSLSTAGHEVTWKYSNAGDWKVFMDSSATKARNGFKVYVSPSGDRCVALRGARAAGFEGEPLPRSQQKKPAEQAAPSIAE